MKNYGGKEIVNESMLSTRQFDTSSPNWLATKLNTVKLGDEAELINLGFEKESKAISYSL